MNKCVEKSCSTEKNKEACLHEVQIEGGASTCTWVNQNGGKCFPCNVIYR